MTDNRYANPIYLNLGAGSHKLPGFINVDLDENADVRHDLSQPLPWADNSVDGIYSEHFIEHLSQADGIHLMRECRRILKPGSRIRVATPDLDARIEDYVHDRRHPDAIRFGVDWVDNKCEALNVSMRWWGHQWVYNEEELRRVGQMVGLEPYARCGLRESDDPRFRGLEHRDGSRLIVEFLKPVRQLAADARPLVSIAINAFNPRFFAAALDSALAQTYEAIEVVVTDDCPTDAIRQIAEARMANDSRIRYFKNPERLGRGNRLRCFSESQGEFIKFLNDDDLLASHCVERMLDAFRASADITLVTSHRQLIDDAGQCRPDNLATAQLHAKDIIVDGLSVMRVLLDFRLNFVGEPSTVMFRKRELGHVKPDFMSIDKFPVRNVADVAMWFHLAFRGNAVFLADSLSSFRQHSDQVQRNTDTPRHQWATEGWERMKYWWDRKGLDKRRERGILLWKPLDHADEGWRKLDFQERLRTLQRKMTQKATTAPEGWNEQAYLAANPDVAAEVARGSFSSGYQHYASFGRNENRPGAMETRPASPPLTESQLARYRSAEQLMASDRQQDAIDILATLVAEGTDLWMPYNDLGIVALQEGDRATARDFLAAAVGREKEPGMARLNLAKVEAADGRYDDSMEALGPLLQASPPDAAASELATEIALLRERDGK